MPAAIFALLVVTFFQSKFDIPAGQGTRLLL